MIFESSDRSVALTIVHEFKCTVCSLLHFECYINMKIFPHFDVRFDIGWVSQDAPPDWHRDILSNTDQTFPSTRSYNIYREDTHLSTYLKLYLSVFCKVLITAIYLHTKIYTRISRVNMFAIF